PATQAVLRKTAAPVPSAPNRRRYYGTGDEGPSYAAARKDYELRIWDVLSRLRNQINKSRRLASEDAYKTLVSLYDRIVEIDAQLTNAARQSPSPKQSEELSRLNNVISWEMTVERRIYDRPILRTTLSRRSVSASRNCANCGPSR